MNSFGIIFRGEYQELQNNELKHKNTDAIGSVHAAVVLMISMYIESESIYSSSSAVKETSEYLFIRYLCFIVVVFVHSRHHCLQIRSISLNNKISRLFHPTCWRSTLPIDSVFCYYLCLNL